MKHKGLFLLVLFFLHSVLFSAYNNEIMNQIVDELRDKTVFEILQRDYYGKERSIQIIQYINNRPDLDQKECSKLLLRCKFNNENHEILINNKEKIMTHLRTLSLENILNLKCSFNKNVSGLIIKYINEKKDLDKEPYIKLLVICHPEAVDYGKCIKDNKDEIVNNLNDLPLENILNIRFKLNQNISELIINHINTIKEKDKEPYVKLLVICNPKAKDYGECINKNKDELVNKLGDVSLADILNIRFRLNKDISELIINHINTIKKEEDKEPYIKLLLKCHPEAVGYGDCITENAEKIINQLSGMLLVDILNTVYVFDQKVSKLIFQYINQETDKKKKNECIQLLLTCDFDADGYEDCINKNKDELVNKLGDVSLADILNIRFRLNKDISELIINHINTIKKEEDKEPYIKLLLKCHPEAVGYGKCITENAEKIINQLSGMLLENILNLKVHFNKNISKLIINHINKEKDEVKKNKLIILLVNCHPDADGYEDCINENKDELVNKLGDVSLENIFNNPHLFNRKVSEEIVNYMMNHSNNNKFKKNFNLLLNLNLEGATENTMNNYAKLLVEYCVNPVEFDTMAKDYQRKKYYNQFCENEINNIKRLKYFKELKNNNRLVDLQIFSKGLIVIGGVGLTASHWSNIEYLEKPAIKNVLKGFCAIGCIGIASVIYHNRKQEKLLINRNQEESCIITKIKENRRSV